jgi:hypothetical protein
MNWHVVTRVGADDSYDGELPREEPRILTSVAKSDDPWAIGNDVYSIIHARVGRVPSIAARDLLHLAFAVFSADLRIPRKLFQDRWTRNLVVHLPVADPALWNELTPLLSRMLAFLSGDNWQFRIREGRPFSPPIPDRSKAPTVNRIVNRVSLFSGGLDSLVGAIDLLEQGETIALVGHHGAGMTNQFQQNVLKTFRNSYAERAPEFMFWVQPPKRKKVGEPSMRSRSLLFLSLGLGVASALAGGQPLVVAENGLISLNVALTNSRLGSLSTRTTHPFFLTLFREFVAKLGLVTEIQTPYRLKTKGEMLAEVKSKTVLDQTLKSSMSCSHTEAGRYQGRTPGVHCGYCVPCIIRRAATASSGFQDSPYDFDVLTSALEPEGKGADLRAFQMALERFHGSAPHYSLFRVLGSGPLPHDEASDYAAVFSRGMKEVGRLLMPDAFHDDKQ